ncbi:MAG: hypothetical protein JST89_20560 [Cyanobacteria bacterium SZAS-4]|nr:hypothetical protein [Cyanobacteria bacterium SZAS-4]
MLSKFLPGKTNSVLSTVFYFVLAFSVSGCNSRKNDTAQNVNNPAVKLLDTTAKNGFALDEIYLGITLPELNRLTDQQSHGALLTVPTNYPGVLEKYKFSQPIQFGGTNFDPVFHLFNSDGAYRLEEIDGTISDPKKLREFLTHLYNSPKRVAFKDEWHRSGTHMTILRVPGKPATFSIVHDALADAASNAMAAQLDSQP